MNWHKAFVPGNHSVANVVAKYLQSKGMEVCVENGGIRTIVKYLPTYKVWTKDPSLASDVTVYSFIMDMSITTQMLKELQSLCHSLTGIGIYTRLPFPEDKLIQPPATAPSLS